MHSYRDLRTQKETAKQILKAKDRIGEESPRPRFNKEDSDSQFYFETALSLSALGVC